MPVLTLVEVPFFTVDVPILVGSFSFLPIFPVIVCGCTANPVCITRGLLLAIVVGFLSLINESAVDAIF